MIPLLLAAAESMGARAVAGSAVRGAAGRSLMGSMMHHAANDNHPYAANDNHPSAANDNTRPNTNRTAVNVSRPTVFNNPPLRSAGGSGGGSYESTNSQVVGNGIIRLLLCIDNNMVKLSEAIRDLVTSNQPATPMATPVGAEAAAGPRGQSLLDRLISAAIALAGPILLGLYQTLKHFSDVIFPVFSRIRDVLRDNIVPFFLNRLPEFFLHTLPNFFTQTIPTEFARAISSFQTNLPIIADEARKKVAELQKTFGTLLVELADRIHTVVPRSVTDSIRLTGRGLINAGNATERDVAARTEARQQTANPAPQAATAVPIDRNQNLSKQAASQYINWHGNVNWDGVQTAFKRRFLAMAREYKERTGRKIQVNSAYRSTADQARLYARYGPGRAAPPGRSGHEFGAAIDMNSADGNAAQQLGLLNRYNFIRPVRGEAWHVVPGELRGNPRGTVPDGDVVASGGGATNPATGQAVPPPNMGASRITAPPITGVAPQATMVPAPNTQNLTPAATVPTPRAGSDIHSGTMSVRSAPAVAPQPVPVQVNPNSTRPAVHVPSNNLHRNIAYVPNVDANMEDVAHHVFHRRAA